MNDAQAIAQLEDWAAAVRSLETERTELIAAARASYRGILEELGDTAQRLKLDHAGAGFGRVAALPVHGGWFIAGPWNPQGDFTVTAMAPTLPEAVTGLVSDAEAWIARETATNARVLGYLTAGRGRP